MVIILLAKCQLPDADKKREHFLMPASHRAANNHADSLKYLCQYWEITDADHPTYRDVFSNNSGIYNYPGLVFFNDLNIAENPRGEVRYGRYKLANRKIEVVFNDSSKSLYKMMRMKDGNMELARSEKSMETLLYLKGDSVNYTIATASPFHPDNNLWRIRPLVKESDEQLKIRLRRCVAFYEKYFYDNLQRKSKDIIFDGLPSCFVWYKGGIYVQSEDNLDKKFIDCFFSKEQAFKARQILEDAMKKKYKWKPNVPNWIEQTAPVLHQIHDSL